MWKHVGREQWPVEHSAHGFNDFRATVTGIRDEHTARPINPLISPFVTDEEVVGLVPQNRRLAGH